MRVNAMNVVTGSLGWATGDVGIIPSSDSCGAEGLDPTNGRPPALASLLNITIALGFIFCFLILFQFSVHLYWKYRANRAFYSKNVLVGLVLKGKVQSFDELDKLSSKANTAFRPFPKVFVFPSLFVFAFKLFATGLVKNAAALLATPATSCGTHRNAIAYLALGAAAAFILFACCLLTHFNLRYRKYIWKRAVVPSSALKSR